MEQHNSFFTSRRQSCFAIVITLLLSCGIACKEDPADTLPPATQEGKNTLACLIDGKRWVPYSNDFKRGSSAARYVVKDKVLSISGANDEKIQTIGIGIRNYDGKTGSYQLDSSCTDFPRLCANLGFYSPTTSIRDVNTYWTDYRSSGQVIITKHTSGFVSGTFEFMARHKVTGQAVRITNGRFDMPYRTTY